MFFGEDSDMKIVGQEAPVIDETNEVEELRQEEANGNLARARARCLAGTRRYGH